MNNKIIIRDTMVITKNFNLLSCLLIISLFSSCKESINNHEETQKGTIILLHGISSAGKSTAARQLQELLNEPYLYFDPDISPAPAKIFKEGSQEGVTFEPLEINGEKMLVVKTGSYIKKLGMAATQMYALFADLGFNIILNFAFGGADQTLAEEFLKKYIKELHNYNIYFINLTVSPEVAAQRELARGGLYKGLAAGQRYSMLKSLKPDSYDLEIDTTELTPEQIAQEIVAFMKSHKNPDAFKRLYKDYSL
jgi:chloramphenicol 3-O phosphotransferase